MMKVTLLGTGTSTGVPVIGCKCRTCTSTDPRDKRFRCSALVQVPDESAPDGMRHILFDCGPDFRLQMLSVSIPRLDAVFCSHEHYDHVGGLDDLRPYCMFGDVTVYGDDYCVTHLRQRIPYCFTPVEKRYPGVPKLDLEEAVPGEIVKVGNVGVLPIRVMHGKLGILGFRIDNFAYVTDMKTIDDENAARLEGVKYMILNGLRHWDHPSHQSIEEAIDFARKLHVKETYLIHMSHHILPHAEEELRMPEGIQLAYDGQTFTCPDASAEA